MIHPIVDVARDGEGGVCRVSNRRAAAGANRGCRSRSRASRDPSALAAPDAKLDRACSADVRRRGRRLAARCARPCGRSPARSSAEPPPLPPSEIAESIDFLRWLDDDNFTYLGFREFPVSPPAAEAPVSPPLGILRRSDAIPVFGGLRDLAALPPRCAGVCPPPRIADRHQDRRAAPPCTARRRWTRSASAASTPPARSSRCGCSSACLPRSPIAAARARSRCCAARCGARRTRRPGARQP